MSWTIALFVGAILAVVAWDQWQKPKRLAAARERDARRAEEVAKLGWKLEVERSGENALIHRYSGTTDGIAWTCEMNYWQSSRINGNRAEKVFTRWSTSDATLHEGMLAVWPSHGKADQIGPQVPQFIMNMILSPLVRALGGDENDAALLTQLTPVPSDDPTIAANYLLRATDPSAMHRFLESGARETLVEAAAWAARNNAQRLTLAVIRRSGMAVLVRGWVDDLPTLQRIVTTGAGLANAFRTLNG